MSWLSLSDKGKWCPTDLNAFCFSIINIWCWVMSELNASDITSQPCKMQHSVETWTFPLAGRDARYGCGYEALQLHSSVLNQQKNSAQLFPLHITINLNTAMLEKYSTDSCHDTLFEYLCYFWFWFLHFRHHLVQSCQSTSAVAHLPFDICMPQMLSPSLV